MMRAADELGANFLGHLGERLIARGTGRGFKPAARRCTET
jgi:hypothetical protein